MTRITEQQLMSDKRVANITYRSAKWGFLATVVLAIFAFFSFFAKQFSATSLEISLKDKKVSINTTQLVASPENVTKRDPEKYYIDSSKGFSFKKLVSRDWARPSFTKGAEEVLAAKSFVMNPELKNKLLAALQVHPLGRMLREVEAIRYASVEQLNVEITDDSTTPISEEIINNAIKSAQAHEPSPDANEISAAKNQIRRALIGFQSIKFANELTVYVYEKGTLKGIPVKHTLPSFFISAFGSFGMFMDKLVADERTILAGGSVTIQKRPG